MAKILYLNFVENQKGAPAIYEDILANIPAPGLAGRLFVSTDTLAIYRDTGVAWDLISGGGGGTVDSVSGADGISVDNTDPTNPIVELGDSVDGSSVPFTSDRFIDMDGNTLMMYPNGVGAGYYQFRSSSATFSISDGAGNNNIMDNSTDALWDTSNNVALLKALSLIFTLTPPSPLTSELTATDLIFTGVSETSDLAASEWSMFSNADSTINTNLQLNDLLMQDSGGVDNMNLTELVLQFNNSINQSAALSAGEFEMNDAAAAQLLGATCDLGFFAQSVSSGNQTMYITNEGFSWQQFSGGGGAYVTLTDGEMQFFDPTNNFINTIGADSQTMEDETTNNTLNLTPDSLFLSDALASFETLFTKQNGYIGLPSGSAALATFDVWGGGISTNDPDTGTNDQIWEFGAEVAAAGVLDTTKYLAVWINGTRYQLATFT